jgi:hypothetical protein
MLRTNHPHPLQPLVASSCAPGKAQLRAGSLHSHHVDVDWLWLDEVVANSARHPGHSPNSLSSAGQGHAAEHSASTLIDWPDPSAGNERPLRARPRRIFSTPSGRWSNGDGRTRQGCARSLEADIPAACPSLDSLSSHPNNKELILAILSTTSPTLTFVQYYHRRRL